jgi:hypothetical protein
MRSSSIDRERAKGKKDSQLTAKLMTRVGGGGIPWPSFTKIGSRIEKQGVIPSMSQHNLQSCCIRKGCGSSCLPATISRHGLGTIPSAILNIGLHIFDQVIRLQVDFDSLVDKQKGKS